MTFFFSRFIRVAFRQQNSLVCLNEFLYQPWCFAWVLLETAQISKSILRFLKHRMLSKGYWDDDVLMRFHPNHDGKFDIPEDFQGTFFPQARVQRCWMERNEISPIKATRLFLRKALTNWRFISFKPFFTFHAFDIEPRSFIHNRSQYSFTSFHLSTSDPG